MVHLTVHVDRLVHVVDVTLGREKKGKTFGIHIVSIYRQASGPAGTMRSPTMRRAPRPFPEVFF